MRSPLTVLLGDRLVAGQASRLAAELGDPFRVVVPDGEGAFTPDGLVPFAAQADVIVATGLASPTIEAARRCRLVQSWIAGVDRFDLEAMARAGLVLSAAHGNAVAVAEHALGLVLALGRHIVRGDRALRRGDWSVGFAAGAPPHAGVSGRTVTVVGYGSIGRAFGRLAAGFGFRLIGVRRHPERSGADGGPVTIVGLDRLDWALGQADVVVLALPKTRETVGLIDARRLAAMRRDAWLVQVGRSETVDEAALFEACRDRRIAGAGLDVWWRYPPPHPRLPARFPFHELDNVVLTPHSSGWTVEGLEAQMAFVVDNLRRFARGEPIEGVVDLELGY
ncbi:MAG TPA: 2-hydroxyacid dehydrogenase [Thermodesulfobacteriota bacterium]